MVYNAVAISLSFMPSFTANALTVVVAAIAIGSAYTVLSAVGSVPSNV